MTFAAVFSRLVAARLQQENHYEIVEVTDRKRSIA